ncbi:MAG TPA: hypothetical protein VH416_07240 [Gaiellaceae bacterium]
MRARMATFQVDDPAKVDEEVATTRRYLEGGELPEGIPATGFLMMVDRDAGKVIEVLLFESDEDLQRGDETMNSYAPGEGSMHRVSVERFDVPVRYRRLAQPA